MEEDLETLPDDFARPSWLRWYILGAFSLTSFNNSYIWITFSPVIDIPCDYLETTTRQIDLILNWSPIIYCFASVIVIWLSSEQTPLRKMVLTAAALFFSSSLVRCLPVWLQLTPATSVYLMHAGAILNAIGGPLVMSPPALLSATWFPEHERTTATAMACVSNMMGVVAGFFNPYIVSRWCPHAHQF